MDRRRKLGVESDCGSWLRMVAQDWLEGYGPGGRKVAFPSAGARIAAGETILRMVEGCSEARSLQSDLESKLKEEIRKARRRP